MNLSKAAIIIVFILSLGFVMPVVANVSFLSSAPQIITKGDGFSVSSVDAQNGSASIWIIGRDYFDVKTAVQNQKKSWTISLKPEDTEKFPAGKYAIVVQDPGPDGLMEIDQRIADNGNITIQNRGKKIADIGPSEALGSNIEPVVTVLDSAANLQGVDDSFSTYYFFVEEPSVQFNQVIDPTKRLLTPKTSGDRIILTGSTNMGSENFLRIDIRNLASDAIVTSKLIPIVAGMDLNCWTYTLEAPGLPPGDYSATLGWLKSNTTSAGTALFVVENPVPPTIESLHPTVTVPVVPPLENTSIPLILTAALILVLIIIIYTTQRK